MIFFTSLQDGSRRVLRLWPLALVLLAANFATAACLAVVPAAALWGPAHRPAIQTAADGIEAGLLLELVTMPLTSQHLGGAPLPPAYQQAFLVLLGLLVVTPLATLLPSAFLHGGAWLTLREAPQPFSFKRFVWGGAHWYLSFLALGLGEGLVGVSVCAALAFLLPLTASWFAPLGELVLVVGGLVGGVSFVLCELAGATLIVEQTRNPLRALQTAVQWLGQKRLPLAGIYFITLAALLLLHLFFNFGVFPVLPLAWWPLVLLVQQAFILLRLLTRLWRWGSVLAVIG